VEKQPPWFEDSIDLIHQRDKRKAAALAVAGDVLNQVEGCAEIEAVIREGDGLTGKVGLPDLGMAMIDDVDTEDLTGPEDVARCGAAAEIHSDAAAGLEAMALHQGLDGRGVAAGDS